MGLEPENQELLSKVREQDARRRARKDQLTQVVAKDGVMLSRADGAVLATAALSAVDWMKKELFEDRKRARSMKDRYDRNTLGKRYAGSHRVEPPKNKTKKRR